MPADPKKITVKVCCERVWVEGLGLLLVLSYLDHVSVRLYTLFDLEMMA